uniref:Pecanex-like protein n=1 Tax=Gongylonema pulchrum TaxID=637853 RepID=A0A183DFF2_9BILA
LVDLFHLNEESDGGDSAKAEKSCPLLFHFLIDRLRYLPFARYRLACLVLLLGISIISPGSFF